MTLKNSTLDVGRDLRAHYFYKPLSVYRIVGPNVILQNTKEIFPQMKHKRGKITKHNCFLYIFVSPRYILFYWLF